MRFIVARITLALNTPHNPLLDDNGIMSIFPSSLTSAKTVDCCPLTVVIASISLNFSAYGRNDMMAFCDFRNLDAATIFMALVICFVELTDSILVLTSFKFAITIIVCSLCYRPQRLHFSRLSLSHRQTDLVLSWSGHQNGCC